MPNEGANIVSKGVEYKEICLSVRHYSNLRYLIIPIYISISGAILLTVANKDSNIDHTTKQVFLAVGLFMTMIFLWIEITLDRYITTFAEAAKEVYSETYWHNRPGSRLKVQWAFRFLYAAFFPIWGILLLG